MKILLGDIELSRAIYQAYPSNKPQFLRAEQIVHHQFLFSFGHQWYGEEEISVPSILDNKKQFKKDFRNDDELVAYAHELLTEADVFCGHNSNSFDLKHIFWRCWKLGLPPIEILKVDTLKEARKVFNAPSKSMDNLLKDIGHHGKVGKPNEKDWFAATMGDKEKIEGIVEYNHHDVVGQGVLYESIRPWMANHPQVRIRDTYTGEIISTCRHCHGANLIRRGVKYLRSGRARRNYQCKDCGGYTTTDLIK
jgi:hypothetical protein